MYPYPNGPFGNMMPYSNLHGMNLDWVIQIAKDFLDQYTHIQDIITSGEESLDDKTAQGLADLQTKYNTLLGLLNTWYETHSEDIQDELAEALETAITSFNSLAEAKGVQVINSIPEDYTALTALVNALEHGLSPTNAYNLLATGKSNNATMNGITYAYNQDKSCTITGTATAASFNNLWGLSDALIETMEPGKTYYIYYEAENVKTRVYSHSQGTLAVIYDSSHSGKFTVPANMDNITVRLQVENGTTVNETIKYPIITTAMSNQALEQMWTGKTLETGSDVNSIIDGWYLLPDSGTYPHAPFLPCFLFTVTVANTRLQYAFDFSSRNMSQRRKLNGVWYTWHITNFINEKIKVAMFGDSVMWGRNGEGTGQVDNPIPNIVSQYSRHLDGINYGVGSMGWLYETGGMNAMDKVMATDLTGVKAVCYCYGLNDPDSPLGTYRDTGTDTIMGAIYTCFNYVKTNYPDIVQILIGIPNSCLHDEIGFPEWDWYRVRAGGWSDDSFDAECQKFCDYYHVPYISLKQSPVNSFNITEYLPDGIHPSQDGYNVLGAFLRSQLENILGQ